MGPDKWTAIMWAIGIIVVAIIVILRVKKNN